MRLYWLGHSCFLLQTNDGTRIIMDPFDDSVGYPVAAAKADAVTMSHGHHDHNAIHVVKGQPVAIDAAGATQFKNIDIFGHMTYHDDAGGSKRGKNIVYVFQADGIKIAHMGDLGHVLSEETAKEIGEVDVILVPVGGYYTINAAQAKQVCMQLNAKTIIPMHYKTKYNPGFPISEISEFLDLMPEAQKHELDYYSGGDGAAGVVVLSLSDSASV